MLNDIAQLQYTARGNYYYYIRCECACLSARHLTTTIAEFLINVSLSTIRAHIHIQTHTYAHTHLPTYAFVVFIYFRSVILRLKKTVWRTEINANLGLKVM